MYKHLCISLLFTIMIVSGCFHSKHDPKLQEAFELHVKSMEIANDSKEILDQILDGHEEKEKLQIRLKEWNDNIVEVPGFDHHHHHSHSHDHSHSHSQLELTPDDMLLVQKEFLDSIQSIQRQIISIQSM